MKSLRTDDMRTLMGIVRGPGNYPTPSPDRIERLMKRGLIKRVRATLRPTLKGRLVVLMRFLFESTAGFAGAIISGLSWFV